MSTLLISNNDSFQRLRINSNDLERMRPLFNEVDDKGITTTVFFVLFLISNVQSLFFSCGDRITH